MTAHIILTRGQVYHITMDPLEANELKAALANGQAVVGIELESED